MRLWSRNGRDWSKEFLAVTEALRALRVEEIVLDGEAMAHCPDGLPDFHGLRSEEGGAAVCLFAAAQGICVVGRRNAGRRQIWESNLSATWRTRTNFASSRTAERNAQHADKACRGELDLHVAV